MADLTTHMWFNCMYHSHGLQRCFQGEMRETWKILLAKEYFPAALSWVMFPLWMAVPSRMTLQMVSGQC